MMRKWALVFLSLTPWLPASVPALGLGDIAVRSGLNQPLNAEIELLSVRPEELENITVNLAAREAFEQAGIDRPFLLTELRFQVEQRADGTPYIKAYSEQPIKEPFLNYLVEVNWPSGHLLREYTILLDPPTLMAAQQPVVRAPRASADKPAVEAPESGGTSAETAPPTSSALQANGSYGPTQVGDGLWSIAKGLLPNNSISVQQMMLALLKANPEAFLDDNVNTLKAGHYLRVPALSEITVLSRDEVISAINKHNALWNDPDYRQAIMRVAKGQALPPQAALSEPAPQTEAAPAEPAPQTESAPPPQETVASSTTPEASPALKLVAPEPSVEKEKAAAPNTPASEVPAAGEAAQATAQTGELTAVAKELSLANEALEAKQQENEELRSRLAELEAQTASIQRLMTLRNDELAALQEKLSALEAGKSAVAPAPAAATATPAVDTPAPPSAQQAPAEPSVAPSPAPASAKPAPAIGDLDTGVADQAADLYEQAGQAGQALLTELRSNPMVQGLAALISLLLFSLLWIVNRRRRINAQVIQGDPLAMAPLTAQELQAPIEADLPEETIVAKNDAVDWLAEANVYLAYGRYPQAEEMLKQALDQEPQRQEARVKLLELYHATREKDRFIEQAEVLHTALQGDTSGPLWAKAAVLGKDLAPEYLLFREADGTDQSDYQAMMPRSDEVIPSPAITGDDPAVMSEEQAPELSLDRPWLEPEKLQPADNTIEYDFGLPQEPVQGAPDVSEQASNRVTEEPEAAAAPSEYKPFTDLSAFTLEDIREELQAGLEQQTAASAREDSLDALSISGNSGLNTNEPDSALDYDAANGSSAGTGSLRDMDYQLDFDLEKEANLLAEANTGLSDKGSDTGHEDADEEFDFDTLTNTDEIATKLDLARAYIEMGDPEGAQSILDEVVKEGSDAQRQEAQELLLQVS